MLSQPLDVPLKFDFGTGDVAEGYTRVASTTEYTDEKGYGFDFQSEVVARAHDGNSPLTSDFCTSYTPMFFSLKVPEGNYQITVTYGDSQGPSRTTFKAESRRLIDKKIETEPGQFKTSSYLVNVYHREISGGGEVRLKDRELTKRDWDHKLTLEFSNHMPKVNSIEVEQVEDATTVYLTGNSTVTNQRNEPWASWGQMLPAFFKADKVSVSNQGSSGLTLKGFEASNRLANVLSHMKEGDYLFIQFAHNDQKEGSTYVAPYEGYQEYLKLFIDEARGRGATPVLVTSMHRRWFDDNGQIQNTLGEYPNAMRQLAKEEEIALIDLHAESEVLYEALGVEDSKNLFVHYPAGTFPGQNQKIDDNTHFSNYGAYQLAKIVAEGIREDIPELSEELADDLPAYNPAHPDPYESWELPETPVYDNQKPRGN